MNKRTSKRHGTTSKKQDAGSTPATSTYTLTLNMKQAEVLREALEVFSRLEAGQLDVAIIDTFRDRYCSKQCPEFNHNIRAEIDKIKLKIFPELHIGASYGVGSEVYPDQSIAWDVMQVLRYTLAWDRLRAEGKDKPDFYGVQFRVPMQFGKEPLPKLTSSDIKV